MCSITKDHLAHFPSKATKSKKIQSSRKFVIFRDIELICSNIRKILKFSQKKYFFYLQKQNLALPSPSPEKYPPQKKISYMSRNGTF